MADNKKQEHSALAAQLQTLLLDDYVKLFKDGSATAADRAALAKLLRDNGWTFDPSDVKPDVKDKLTKAVDPSTLDMDDADVISLYGRKTG